MITTQTQNSSTARQTARSERIAIHDQNLQALVAAYVQLRGREPRMIRREADALVREVTMERELWEPGFCAEQFLERLPARLRRQFCLI